MIAAWMLYAMVVGGVAGLATLALDHAARALGRPARFLWLAALVATTAIPAVGFPGYVELVPDLPTSVTASAPLPASADVASPIAATAPRDPTPQANAWWRTPSRAVVSVPTTLTRWDRPLIVAWAAGSLLWVVALLVSVRRIHRERAAWEPALLDGVPVQVSHDVGPALVGVVNHTIVVPRWVLSLDMTQQRLIALHEHEHARARDPLILTLGTLVALAQPWNPATWLMLNRLRFAVEVDCDARVLRASADVRTYGELLLGVGERMLGGAALVAALSEPRSHLAGRIDIMTARIRRPLLRSTLMLTCGATLFVSAALLPRPLLVSAQEVTASPDAPFATPGMARTGRGRQATDRAMVRLTSLGLRNVDSTMRILIYADGPAQVGIAGGELRPLRDTLVLRTLPAIAADVTESDVHVELRGPGSFSVGGTVDGGPATNVSASGTHVILQRGGGGIQVYSSDAPPGSTRSRNLDPRPAQTSAPTTAPATGKQSSNDSVPADTFRITSTNGRPIAVDVVVEQNGALVVTGNETIRASRHRLDTPFLVVVPRIPGKVHIRPVAEGDSALIDQVVRVADGTEWDSRSWGRITITSGVPKGVTIGSSAASMGRVGVDPRPWLTYPTQPHAPR